MSKRLDAFEYSGKCLPMKIGYVPLNYLDLENEGGAEVIETNGTSAYEEAKAEPIAASNTDPFASAPGAPNAAIAKEPSLEDNDDDWGAFPGYEPTPAPAPAPAPVAQPVATSPEVAVQPPQPNVPSQPPPMSEFCLL